MWDEDAFKIIITMGVFALIGIGAMLGMAIYGVFFA